MKIAYNYKTKTLLKNQTKKYSKSKNINKNSGLLYKLIFIYYILKTVYNIKAKTSFKNKLKKKHSKLTSRWRCRGPSRKEGSERRLRGERGKGKSRKRQLRKRGKK